MKKEILLVIFNLLIVPGTQAQFKVVNGKWKIVSKKAGFELLTNANGSMINSIKPNGSRVVTTLKRSSVLPQDYDGILNIEFDAKSVMKKGDSCTFYAIAYKANRPILSFSKLFTDSGGDAAVIRTSRYINVPKGTDSLVTGLILSGLCKISSVQINNEIIQGEQYKKYLAHMTQFASIPANIEQLSTLCKIWGMVKYFSSASVNKNIDLDELLMNSLSDHFKMFKTNIEINELINKLLEPFDTFKVVDKQKVPDELLNVVNKLNISSKNKNKILEILTYPTGTSKYYVPPSDRNPAPVFHEINNDKYPVPDVRARLLFLFRYWNIINYFYPYKSDQLSNWDSSLQTFIPKFILSNTESSYAKSVLMLNASIGDGHAAIPCSFLDIGLALYGSAFTILPLTYSVKGEDQIFIQEIDTNFSSLTGLKTADRLISINDIKIDSLVLEMRKYISHPDPDMKSFYLEKSKWLNVIPFNTDSLKLVYSRKEGREIVKSIPWKMSNIGAYSKFIGQYLMNTSKPHNNQVLTYINEKKLLIIDPFKWDDNLQQSAIKMIENCDQIIIDCRTYPAWKFLEFCERLIQDDVPLLRYTFATSIPGHFDSTVQRSQKDHLSFDKGIYILISEDSQSRSEQLAAILKSGAKKVFLVGRRTAGANGNVSQIPSIGDMKIYFNISGLRVDFANGMKMQQTGIKPDISVIKDINNQTDAILYEALKQINK